MVIQPKKKKKTSPYGGENFGRNVDLIERIENILAI